MARIIIDAGHGGSERAGNSSAYGARGAAGVMEKEVTLDIAKYVVARLGGAAALTRTGDRNMTLGARAAKGQQADVFVSIHANYGAPELVGPEVYVHPDAGQGSRALAGQIARALDRLDPRYGGGGERRGAMAVLNPSMIGTRTAACLVEVDYLSNPRGERRLGDPGERAAIGAAIAGAIQQHLAEGQQPVLAGTGGGRYGYVNEGRRTIRGSAREQIEFSVSTDDQNKRIHLGGEARLIEGPERRLVARLVDMIAPEQGRGNAQYVDLVSGSAVRLPFSWPAQFLGRYAVQLWVESSSPSTRVDIDYTLSLHNYGGSSYGEHARVLDRASPDPFLIPSPSDYVGTGLLNYVAVWGSWFADYAAWRAGVPTAAYSTFPHNAIAELEITRTDGATEVGTGFYVGPNKLLTNGHVFMSGPNRAASIRVRLGKRPGIMWTTGGTTFTISNPASHCHPRWASGNEDGFDLGVLRTPGVSPTQFFSLPNVCPADDQNMVVCGYAKFTADPLPVMQQGQYMDGGRITGVDSELCFFPIQSLPGGSGSPVFWPSHNGMVIAVFSGPRVVLSSSGPQMHPRENRGVLLTPAKNTWIESM